MRPQGVSVQLAIPFHSMRNPPPFSEGRIGHAILGIKGTPGLTGPPSNWFACCAEGPLLPLAPDMTFGWRASNEGFCFVSTESSREAQRECTVLRFARLRADLAGGQIFAVADEELARLERERAEHLQALEDTERYIYRPLAVYWDLECCLPTVNAQRFRGSI